MAKTKVPKPPIQKAKNVMYVQQLQHLNDSLIDIENMVKKVEELNPTKYAIILHDKDNNENGELEEPHYHIMLSFDNARSINSLARHFGDSPQYFQIWKGDSSQGYAYLIHHTLSSRSKFQYEADEVTANFDYNDFILNFDKKEAEREKQKNIKYQLQCLLNGEISREELEASLDAFSYSKYKKAISDVHARRLQLEAAEWVKQRQAHANPTQIIWLHGDAGVGKSSLAKELANKKANGNKIFISGSSKDYFERYSGEHIAIFDDFRANTGSIKYSDLLRILDPYSVSETTMAPSRYADKPLMLDTIIITCPYSPKTFYNKLFFDSNLTNNKNEDSFEQLRRRITLVLKLSESAIYQEFYNGFEYVPIENSAIQNKHSSKARNNNHGFNNGNELFASLFEDYEKIETAEIIQLKPILSPIFNSTLQNTFINTRRK